MLPTAKEEGNGGALMSHRASGEVAGERFPCTATLSTSLNGSCSSSLITTKPPASSSKRRSTSGGEPSGRRSHVDMRARSCAPVWMSAGATNDSALAVGLSTCTSSIRILLGGRAFFTLHPSSGTGW
jgi:hypothetical protein